MYRPYGSRSCWCAACPTGDGAVVAAAAGGGGAAANGAAAADGGGAGGAGDAVGIASCQISAKQNLVRTKRVLEEERSDLET